LITVAPEKGEGLFESDLIAGRNFRRGNQFDRSIAEFAVAEIGQGGASIERFRRQPVAETFWIVDALTVNGGDEV
jgi:molecular chaperone DnaK (HSP70)